MSPSLDSASTLKRADGELLFNYIRNVSFFGLGESANRLSMKWVDYFALN